MILQPAGPSLMVVIFMMMRMKMKMIMLLMKMTITMEDLVSSEVEVNMVGQVQRCCCCHCA